MEGLYDSNPAFKEYVDKYCAKHEVMPEIAFTHSVVRNAYEYYRDAEKGKISVSGFKAGCSGAEMGETK